MNPKISVIVPTYNSRETMKECLRGILDSEHGSYEVLVVDDGSLDGTPDIVKEFSVKLIKLHEHSGAAHARNYGSKEANGEILLFVDSDIIIAKDTLKKIEMRLREDRTAAVMSIYSITP